MNTSTYQNLKLQIVDFIGLSKDAIHIHIGPAAFVATIILWKKAKVTPICLIPVLLLAMGMESVDLYDDYKSVGYMRWSNSIHDMINTLFWPVLIVLFFKFRQRRDRIKH